MPNGLQLTVNDVRDLQLVAGEIILGLLVIPDESPVAAGIGGWSWAPAHLRSRRLAAPPTGAGICRGASFASPGVSFAAGAAG
jgi:hypothetical protein